ncbi:MAG: sulfatase-like hydrolase/transferase [Gammaproteobacteria bacterium]|nr:sulfatase-like hydrolase/transferase [Gammaproteobacteria bacterium]
MHKHNKNMWAFLGLLLLSFNTSYAVVVEDASSSTSAANAQTLSWTHTTGSASERLLIVSVSLVGGTNSVSSVTYGGTDLAQWATESSAFPVHADIWYLVAPPTGDATVEVTLANSGFSVVGATTWSGVDQTDPLGPASVANGTGATASVNVASAADNIVFDVLTWAGAGATAAAGSTQTEYWNDGVLVRNGGSVYGSSSSEPGVADVEMSWDMSNQFTYALVAADIQSASTIPDVTPPTVDITAPTEGAIVSGTIAIDADASDDVGVIGVQFQLDGVDLEAEDTTAPYSINWDTSTSADGSYELTAIARDGADNQTTSTIINVTVENAVVDVTPPTVDITSPADLDTVSGTVTIDADASDDVGVVGVQFQLDGVDLGAEDTTAPYSVDWDTTLEADGDFALTAIARDAADNQTTSATITVSVDNSVAGGGISHDASSSSSAANSSTYSWTHTTGSGADRLLIVGVSLVSGSNSVSNVTYGGTSLTQWATESSAFPVTAEMWYMIAPPAGAATVEVTLANSGFSAAGAASFDGVDQTAPLGTAVAANGSGAAASVNVASSAGNFVFDVLSWAAIDGTATAGTSQTEYFNDGVLVRNGGSIYASSSSEPGAADVEMSWTLTSQLTYAIVAAEIIAATGGGGDVTPPTSDITSPANLDVVSGTVNVDADATDDTGVVGVQFQLDGANLGAEDLTSPYSVSWDTTTAADGDYALTAVARDAANNQTTSAAITVTVDNSAAGTPPTVTITDPADGTSVTDGTSITFVGTADDAEDGSLDDSINWSSDIDGDLGTASTVDATLSVGTHTVTASVTDSDSDTGTDTITVTVNAIGGGSGPNILLIVSDDMGADTSELFPELAGNNGQAPTPRLSQLAAEGIVFDNAWASPQCSPTRATIASGLYGHNTGVLTAGDNLGGTTTSIWEYLASDSPDNYAMAVFGKWHIGDSIGHVTNDTGVPTYMGFLDGFIDDFYNWSYIDETGATTQTATYSTTAITDFAIDFITDHENSANADDPWFVYVPYAAPHGTSANDGFQVPPAGLFTVDVGGRPAGDPTIYNGEISVYQAMIEAMDTEIGRMLDEIELLGELDDTIVIFLGDNGTPAPIQDANVGNRGTKSTVFEGGVHVPMIISGAGVTRIDAREEHVVTSTDIYATIAELAGIAVSEINNSFSLVPLFTDGNTTSGRQFSFSEICGGAYAIRDDRYKVMFDDDTGGFQMYDLQTDPEEQNNLYGDASVAAEQAVLEAELEILEQNATSGGCFQ